MPSELDDFKLLFPKEHDLQIALVDLFSKIPGTKRVQLLQGTLEHGKDIIFRRELLPGQEVLIACIVKNIPITGSAYESSKSAATVMNQVRQALRNPFRDTDGNDIPVHMAFVITPYEVTREVILSVEGDLIDLRGRFQFLSGTRLLELFKEHYPAYITFKGDFFNHYLQDLVNHLECQLPLYTISSSEALLSKVYTTFIETYVEPKFEGRLTTAQAKALSPPKFPFDLKLSRYALDQEINSLHRVATLLFNCDSWCTAHESSSWARAGVEFSKLAVLMSKTWELESKKSTSKANQGISTLTANQLDQIEVALKKSLFPQFDLEALANNSRKCVEEFRNLMQDSRAVWEELHNSEISRELFLSHPKLELAQRAQELVDRCPNLFEKSKNKKLCSASQIELMTQNESFSVTGPPGYGKTTFCKWNAIKDAKTLLDSGRGLFPVYLPLHRLNEIEPQKISLLSEQVEEFLSGHQSEEHDINGVRIYLDGLDEVKSREKRNAILNLAKKGLKLRYSSQFVITSRDSAYNARMASFPRFRIQPLSLNDAKQLVNKILRNDPVSTREFWQQLKLSGGLTELMTVPLLLQLTASVFQQTKKIPQNRYRLYQMFLELMAHGWDRARSIERGFHYESDLKLKVLQNLAGRLHTQGKRETSSSEVNACISLVCSVEKIDTAIFISEILHQGLLIQSGVSYLFPHLSFQEYLAARDLNDPSGIRQSKALHRFLSGDDWWREVIAFFINGHSSPFDLELWAIAQIRNLAHSLPSSKIDQLEIRVEILKNMFTVAHPGFTVNLPSVSLQPS